MPNRHRGHYLHIIQTRFPEAERMAAEKLGYHISMAAEFLDRIAHNLHLFETARSSLGAMQSVNDVGATAAESIVEHWMWTAARDSAMALNHFKETLSRIKGCARRCETLAGERKRIMETADADFQTAFPDAYPLRQAVGHEADYVQGRNRVDGRIQAGGIDLDGEHLVVMGLGGNEFYATVDGRTTRLEISETTLLRLHAIYRMVLSAFNGLDDLVSIGGDPPMRLALALQRDEDQTPRRS